MDYIVITKTVVWRVHAKSVQRLTQALHDVGVTALSVTPVTWE